MNFSTPRVMALRPVTDDDHAWLVELHNDPDVLQNLTNPVPITMEQHEKWWKEICGNPREQRLVFVVDGERVGFTKFYAIDTVNQNCVLGADIHRSHRGQGLAKHMWNLMLYHAFMSLCLNRVSLTTAAFNTIAQRVYSSLGFKEEGRLTRSLYRDNAYHDQMCMYLLKEDWASRHE